MSPVVVILALMLAAVVYARGWVRLRRRLPQRFGWGQLLCFMAGLDLLFVALVALPAAGSLLTHMLQHLLLMMAVPPLIWLGAPVVPLLRGLPDSLARAVIGPVSRCAPFRALSRVVTHPSVCWLAFTIAIWGWHIPDLYELALSSEAWHHAEHALFLGAGLLFWWPVIQPWPSRPRWPRWAMVPYLLLAEVHNTVLAAFFTFAGRALYPTYVALQGAGPALHDQIMAGVLMWGPGSMTLLVPVGYLALRLLAPSHMTSEDSPLPVQPGL